LSDSAGAGGQANELALCVFGATAAATYNSPGNGFSIVNQVTIAGQSAVLLEYIATTIAGFNPSVTASTTVTYASTVTSFYRATGP
jgi:hypothetical protein